MLFLYFSLYPFLFLIFLILALASYFASMEQLFYYQSNEWELY